MAHVLESPDECKCGTVWDAAEWVSCPRCQLTDARAELNTAYAELECLRAERDGERWPSVQLREDLATAIARAERAERLHSEAEAQIECRNEMRARVAQAERERDEAQRERYDLAQLIGKALIEIWCAPGERLAEEVDHAIVIDARRLRLRAELAERERDGYLAGYETELEVRRKAEAEVARLRGLIHAEQIAEMRYCETCELGYMVGEGSARPCPYCEVARMRAVVDAAVNWQKGEKDSKYDLYNSVVIYLRSTSELVSGKESVR